jgi:hypothetical protein
MHDYNAQLIKTHTWPVPQQLPDGRWRRAWTIRLKEEPLVSTAMEVLSSEITQEVVQYLTERDRRLESLKDDLVISLEFTKSQGIIAGLITEEGGWPDELLFAAWRLFQDVDRILGTIDTIDGQGRDRWPPWNFRQADEGSEYKAW